MRNTEHASGSTVAAFVLQAALWGSSFSLIKIALAGLSPGQLVLGRLLLGAGVLLLVAAARRVGLPTRTVIWLHLLVVAVLSNVAPFLLLSYGELSAGAGIAGVLVGSTPLLTLAIAAVAIKSERVTARKVVGLVVGFVGVVITIGPWRQVGTSLAGVIACFGAAISYAVGYVYVRRFVTPRRLAPLGLAAGQLACAVALQAVVMLFLPGHTPVWTGPAVAALVSLGVLSTGVAYVLYFRLIGDVGATSASAVNYAVPPLAVLFGVVLLGEAVGWNLLVGGLILLGGMAFAENRFLRSRGPSTPPIEAALPPGRAESSRLEVDRAECHRSA